MTTRLLAFVCLGACLLASAPAAAQTFVFHLRGDQEVPPVPSAASGGCIAVLDQPGGRLDLTCVHDVVGATIMHVHNAAAGANGAIVFDLGDPASPVTTAWTGMTSEDVDELLAGRLYVNVHTAGRPDGEIRGQILPRTVDTVAFTASGAEVVPPHPSEATADCSANLDDAAVSLAVQCTHDLASPDSAHVHVAPFGQNGPIVFTFASPASPLAADVPLSAQRVADFAAGFLYLDVHRDAAVEPDPGDDIRGQIGDPPIGATTGTIRIVKGTHPPGGGGFTFTDDVPGSPGTFTLDDGETQEFFAVAPGTYTVTENDPASGGHALTHVDCDDGDSAGDPYARTATVRLAAAESVTCAFTNMSVAPTDDLFVFELSGAQEVPPVTGPARGGCAGRYDSPANELALVCVHDVVNPTLMHVHRGAAGVNGDVVFDLGSPVSPVHATWPGLTAENVVDLFAGNFYVNVHTAGRPAGEIRGQVVQDGVDVVSFSADGAQVVPPDPTTATGDCNADLAEDASTLAVQCTHDLAGADQAHLHAAPFGQNGPLVHDFGAPSAAFAGDVPMTPRTVAELAATFLYVDVHATGGGEGAVAGGDIGASIRGQVGTPPATPTTGTIHVTKIAHPASAALFSFTEDLPGATSFQLAHGQTQSFFGVPAGTYTITEVDPSGAGHAATAVLCSDADSVGNPFARTATVQLEAGETVTCTFVNMSSGGADRTFLFHLSGDQEAPPVASAARGGCFGQLDLGAGELALLCVHDVAGPTLMHVHRGLPGENGPVVFDLGSPVSPVHAVWSGMTPSDLAELLAGNLYVNVHTAGRPSGEIRGQLLARTVDAFAFGLDAGQTVPPGTSPAQGTCSVDVDDAATALAFGCTHGLAQPTAAHLHQGARGTNGPIAFTFASAASPFAGHVPATPRLLADFAAGFLYVDVHRDAEEGASDGIRGQVLPGQGGLSVDVPTLGAWAAAALALALAALGVRRLSG